MIPVQRLSNGWILDTIHSNCNFYIKRLFLNILDQENMNNIEYVSEYKNEQNVNTFVNNIRYVFDNIILEMNCFMNIDYAIFKSREGNDIVINLDDFYNHELFFTYLLTCFTNNAFVDINNFDKIDFIIGNIYSVST